MARIREGLPLYCLACGAEQDASKRVNECRVGSCRQKAFTTSASALEWAIAMTHYDVLFLAALRIAAS